MSSVVFIGACITRNTIKPLEVCQIFSNGTLSLIMSFSLVKALRSSQQLAWIALSYNCYQLLGVNIFRVSRCGIKFRSTC